MPYIGNVVTSFAVETGNINDQAVTAPKLSATGGTDGQVLALDSNLNLEWVSDPAGQWVTSGSNIYYNDGNVGIGLASPSDLLEITPTSTREGLTIKTTGTTFGGINIDTNRTGAGHTLGDIRFMWNGTGVAGITGHTGSDTTNKDDGRLIFNTASAGSATERMRIDSAGNVGIGTTSPGAKLELRDNTQALLSWGDTAAIGSLSFDGSSQPVVRALSGKSLVFQTNGSNEQARIDSSGRLLVGTASAVDTSDEAIVHIVDTLGARLVLGRNDTTVADGNGLGGIRFAGNDTTSNTFTTLGEILCQADGTHAAGDNPTRLTFKTTADGSDSATERMRIDNAGNVGIGVTAPSAPLHTVAGGEFDTTDSSDFTGVGLFLQSPAGLNNADGVYGAALAWSRPTDTNNFKTAIAPVQTGSDLDLQGLAFFTANSTSAGVAPSERMRIDSAGRLLVGRTSALNVGAGSAATTEIQNSGNFNLSLISTLNSSGAGGIAIGKARGGSVVQDDDDLGSIVFAGHDGTDFETRGAQITAQVDGTPGSNDMPGRLLFSTTSDGASGPTERMRIDSSGRVGIGTSSPDDILDVRSGAAGFSQFVHASGQGGVRIAGTGASSSANLVFSNNHNSGVSDEYTIQMDGSSDSLQFLRGGTGGGETMRLDSSGRIGIGGDYGLGASNRVSINPADGLIGLGMDGRDSYITDTSGCYIYSGSGSSGTTLAGELILQSRSNVTRSIKFITGSTPSERARIDNDGLKFNGDTAAANGLDDYEEGTFTPTLALSTPGNSSVGYSNQTGRYVKVGKIVYFSLDIRLSSFSRGTGTGGFQVQGLPVVPVDTNNYHRANGFANLYNWNYASASNQIPTWNVIQDGGVSALDLTLHREDNTNTSDIGDPGSTSMIFISGTYEATS